MSIIREYCQGDFSYANILADAAKAGFICGHSGGHDCNVNLEIWRAEEISSEGVFSPFTLHIREKAS